MLAALRALARNFPWLHVTLGLIGNLAFVAGSVLFLWESLHTAGVGLFIVGSSGMLLGSLGAALLRWEERRRGNRDLNWSPPRTQRSESRR